MEYVRSEISKFFNLQPASTTATSVQAPLQLLQVIVSVKCSSPVLWVNSDEPFSIILSAYVAGTNGQPITTYAQNTLLHPNSPTLEQRGLVFSNTVTRIAAKRSLVDIVCVYPADGIPVARSTQSDFLEIPSDPAHPYEVTFRFKGKGNIVNHRIGLLPDQRYEISLGSKMSVIKWYEVGLKAAVLRKGERSGERVKPMENVVQAEMIMKNQCTFDVRYGGQKGEGLGVGLTEDSAANHRQAGMASGILDFETGC